MLEDRIWIKGAWKKCVFSGVYLIFIKMGYLIGAGVLAILGLILWVMKGKKEGKSATLSLMDTLA